MTQPNTGRSSAILSIGHEHREGVTVYQHILLAIDGSAASKQAIAVVASLAVCENTQVTVLHVFTPISSDLGSPNFDQVARKALEKSRQLVDNATTTLHDLGVTRTESDVIAGEAADVILTLADTRSVDLIVLGARGLNRLQSILLGSVSLTVAQRAHCRVLIVK